MTKREKSDPVDNTLRSYKIEDKDATEIAGVRVTDDHRKNGIALTGAQAQFYLASGSISLASEVVDQEQAAAAIRSTAAIEGTTSAAIAERTGFQVPDDKVKSGEKPAVRKS